MKIREAIARGVITDAKLILAHSGDTVTLTSKSPLVMSPQDKLLFMYNHSQRLVVNDSDHKIIPEFVV